MRDSEREMMMMMRDDDDDGDDERESTSQLNAYLPSQHPCGLIQLCRRLVTKICHLIQ